MIFALKKSWKSYEFLISLIKLNFSLFNLTLSILFDISNIVDYDIRVLQIINYNHEQKRIFKELLKKYKCNSSKNIQQNIHPKLILRKITKKDRMALYPNEVRPHNYFLIGDIPQTPGAQLWTWINLFPLTFPMSRLRKSGFKH